MLLIIEGLIVHVIFLLSIFDIYFKSPIISGIQVQDNNVIPPAKRLVLIVADGLRADSFYNLESGNSDKYFFRDVIEKRGVWGVCHTRVPTESRPGHVALIAGFYEDPSAVFKGWKENPVEFDSLFNQSTITYSWGSRDILPIFTKGPVDSKVQIHTYPPDLQNFSGKNESALLVSKWVFEKVEQFLENAATNSNLNDVLHKNGVILFLHLLGTDIAGHVNKPHSEEYKENIEFVDKGIGRIEKLIRNFYNDDNETAFVFTSDHGMTDWGSHGAGSISETQTPIVAWGAGVSGPKQVPSRNSNNWFRNLLRRDVNQADLVPLMSVLVGNSIPVHSLGILPLSYLNVADKTGAEALFLNSQQLYSQFRRHREIIEKDSLRLLYKPFPDLTIEKEAVLFKDIKTLMHEEKYQDAISKCKLLNSLVLAGLKYYQNYYQNMLLFSISCLYIGWIAWLFIQILPYSIICYEEHRSRKTRVQLVIGVVFSLSLLISILLIFAQNLPLQYYIYCCLPIIIWWAVFHNHAIFSSLLSYVHGHYFETARTVIIYGVGIELLVLTFFYHWVLCVILFGLAVWPIIDKQYKHKPFIILFLWFLSCLGLAIFPALPVVGSSPNIILVVIAGWLWFLAGIGIIINQVWMFKNKEDCLLLAVQLTFFPLTVWIVSSTANSYDSKEGLPILNQILSWTLLVVCPFIPLFGPHKLMPRLIGISLSLAVPFLLMSIGHEAFFCLVLMMNLFSWITLEQDASVLQGWIKVTEKPQDLLTPTDFRRSFFFIFYITMSFFGSGNIASVNSFDPVWVRCFLTVFAPFTMSILILIKILIPFLLVSCSFRALNIRTKGWPNHLFVMILIQCDFMGLHFLYAVTNEGSWLQIGTSISHFVIVQSMIIFMAIFYAIANVYMSSSFICASQSTSHSLQGQSLESRAVHVKTKQHYYNCVARNCGKCSENEAEVVLRGKDPYCRSCFLAYATHKFRASLGKSKLVRKGDKVLVGFSGSGSSLALVRLIKAGIEEETHKKLVFEPFILYIDEGAAFNLENENRINTLEEIRRTLKQFSSVSFIANLESIFQSDGEKIYYELNTDLPVPTSDSPLSNLLSQVKCPSSKEELLVKLRNNLLLKVAADLGCSKILTAETLLITASKLLSNISLGRGAQLPLDVGFCDSREEGIKILRPMQDFGKEEIDYYCKIYDLKPVTSSSCNSDGNSVTSIQMLTRKFVDELQENFPSTVSTVYRTGAKLMIENQALDAMGKCSLCKGPLDTNVSESSSLQATVYSSLISKCSPSANGSNNRNDQDINSASVHCNGNDEGCKYSSTTQETSILKDGLCYGCRLIVSDIESVELLPKEVLTPLKENQKN